MADFDPIFKKTLGHEGGFQADAADKANYCDGKLIGTNHGISAIAYKGFYKKCPTQAQMKALTIPQAEQIFKKNYWSLVNGDRIANQSIAELMFQYVIGSGASQLSDLKAIANATAGKKIMAEVDVPFTNAEADLINKLPQKGYWINLRAWREAFLKTLVQKHPEDQKFLTGWLNRLNSYTYSGPNDAKGNLLNQIVTKVKNAYTGQHKWWFIGGTILAGIGIGKVVHHNSKRK